MLTCKNQITFICARMLQVPNLSLQDLQMDIICLFLLFVKIFSFTDFLLGIFYLGPNCKTENKKYNGKILVTAV